MTKIVAIVGPTASGKTSLASLLCRKFNGEIISVDSRQAYKEMSVGTGKFSDGMISIPIHLQNVVSMNEELNAFDFSKLAREKIREVSGSGKVPFLVGGSGFYLDVVLGRVKVSEVKADNELRVKLSGLGNDELIKILQSLKSDRLKNIDIRNRYRLLRAVEVSSKIRSRILPCGRTPDPGSWRENHGLAVSDGQTEREVLQAPKDLRCLILGLSASNEILYPRADAKIDLMVSSGLVSEVRALSEKYGWEVPGMKTLGYRVFRSYFEGSQSLEEVVRKLKFDTHSYIRRQKTYFKKNPSIKWFDIEKSGFEEMVVSEIESFI